MITYTVEVYSKYRGNSDHDFLQSDRYNFEDAQNLMYWLNELILKGCRE